MNRRLSAMPMNERAITGNEFPLDQSILAGKLMALTGYRIGTNPEELGKIKAEFEKNYKE